MEETKITLDDKIKEIEDMDEITLKDTVELMNHSDYRVRFIGEYLQTKIRYNSLHRMLIKLEAGTLEFIPTCDSSILEEQCYHMGMYLKQLEIRAEVEKIRLPRI